MILGIFGAGGFGREVLETARLINKEEKRFGEIVFLDDAAKVTEVHGARVLPLDDAAAEFGRELRGIVAVGEPSTRRKLIARLEAAGIEPVTLIHPSVTVPESTTIGAGCYIAPYSFISCDVTIGAHSFTQPHVNISHDCVLGSNTAVCGMAELGGTCTVGDDVFISAGAVIRHGCRIGGHSVVGFGAVVTDEVPEWVKVQGNPAVIVSRIDENTRVL